MKRQDKLENRRGTGSGWFGGAAALGLAMLAASQTTVAADRHVPGAYPTIQAAIDAASAGDTVIVAPGTYGEMIDYLGKDITVESTGGPGVTTIDAQGAGSVVTFASGEDEFATLDGFTVTGGSAPKGGGIFIDNSGPTLRNLIVTGNRTGDSPSDSGGGLYVGGSGPTTTTVIDCDFTANTAASGAAISVGGNDHIVVVRGSNVIGNHSTGFVFFGSIVSNQSDASLRMVECTFEGNTGSYDFSPTMLAKLGFTALTNCRFVGNLTEHSAIQIQEGHVRVIGCEITGNAGHGIAHLGGAGPLEILNSTISDNSGSGVMPHRAVIRNSVVWGNGGADFHTDLPEFAQISHSNIGGSGGSTNWNSAYGTDEGGNIDVDPLYADAESGNFTLGAGSPCIDAADTDAVPADEFDLDGDEDTAESQPWDLNGAARVVDDPDTEDTGIGMSPTVDMGAFEYQTPCLGDLDDSGSVDFNDLIQVLAAWGNEGAPADLDGSGVVDFGDLLLVVGSWGPCE